MQKSVAVILIIAAFLAGALTDRVLRWASLDAPFAFATPTAPAAAASPASAQPDRGIVDNNPDYPPTWDMKGCMTSANRRGMTAEEANHACQEVLK